MYINRTIKDEVFKRIKNRPITLITGARQVGKSTLCQEIVKELGFKYVTLDNLTNREQAMNDPQMFLKINKWPLIIDEAQYAPKLFDVIEEIVNNEKFNGNNNYSMFVLTGSQSYNLMSQVTQSMAGRVSILNMPPLSMSEINNKEENHFTGNVDDIINRVSNYNIDVDHLYERIIKGFYPELYSNENLDYELFYSDYVQSYIERDVSQILNLSNKYKFKNFMEVLASLTGCELIYDNIAKIIGVDVKTIQSWVSVLVSGDIITLIQPFNELSVTKRIVKRQKIYFNDTGLACYLAKLNNSQTLMRSAFSGRFIETYIVNEIMKSYKNNGKNANFYHYRDSNQNEIDLIVLYEGKLTLIECKSGVSFNKSHVKAFKCIKSNYEIATSYLICNTDTIYKIDENVYAIPITSI
ncbi:MAG: ATP-binding protein [bacterium]